MDKTILKEVVFEQQHALNSFSLGTQREILPFIKKYLSMPHTIAITGIRRVGKSTLLAQIINKYYQGNVYYLSFEDERLINFTMNDFNNLHEIFIELLGEKKVFFLDEIQNVPGWELFVRRMQDNGHKFFVTGSNASLLSQELGTKLTGRCMTIELYPFSYKEFLLYKRYTPSNNALLSTKERGKLKRYFSEYLETGGMPEYLKYQDRIVLKRLYDDILYRDIVARYEIKEVKALRELGFYLLSNTTALFSYNNIKQMLKLGSVNTIKNYIEYMENCFLVFVTNRFAYSVKQQLIAPKKCYCIDNGIIQSVSFQFSKNKGKFLENLVFIELKRKIEDIYYYKTMNDLEVDFLIKTNKNMSLIQVTEGLYNEKIRQREIASLLTAMEELSMKNSIILTEDHEETIKDKNKLITVQPVYKWLLR